MPESILQNEATAALREVSVRLYDLAGNPATGKAATVTIKIAKPGANLGAADGSTVFTEVTGGAGGGGGYRLRFVAGDVNTVGELHAEISHATIQTAYVAVPIRPALRTVDLADNMLTGGKLDATAITAIQAGLATEAMIKRLGNLLHENAMADNFVYGARGVVTGWRVRGWDNAAGLAAATDGAANNADGETARWVGEAEDLGGGQIGYLKLTKAL